MSADGLLPARLFLAAAAVNCRSGSQLDRAAARQGLLDILDTAANAAGLPTLAWLRRSDETELAELPVEGPARRVVDRFLAELDAALFRHNVARQRAARLRVRVAIHCGRSATEAARLADLMILHEALRLCPEANLGVLLSAGVFDDSTATQRPEWLRKVRTARPTSYGAAWLLMPGHDVHALPLTGSGYPVPAAHPASSV